MDVLHPDIAHALLPAANAGSNAVAVIFHSTTRRSTLRTSDATNMRLTVNTPVPGTGKLSRAPHSVSSTKHCECTIHPGDRVWIPMEFGLQSREARER